MENNENLIKCAKISVDCVHNDPVDVRCGGPLYLGFDFNVKIGEEEEMKEFIKLTLEMFDVPLKEIYVSEMLNVDKKRVWNKERIVECIQREASYLRGEAAHNYDSSSHTR